MPLKIRTLEECRCQSISTALSARNTWVYAFLWLAPQANFRCAFSAKTIAFSCGSRHRLISDALSALKTIAFSCGSRHRLISDALSALKTIAFFTFAEGNTEISLW